MSETTFLVKMGKTCDYMLNYAGTKKCTKFREATRLNLCDGNLKKRPNFCPLICMREVKTEYDIVYGSKWVLEGVQ